MSPFWELSPFWERSQGQGFQAYLRYIEDFLKKTGVSVVSLPPKE